MKIEKAPVYKRKKKSGILKKLLELKPGQCLRITTAREAYNVGGINLKHHGYIIARQVDGDDLLVWKEPIDDNL